jgi:serine protease Do
MSWFSRFKGQKVISVAAVLATLTTGILIGTLINSDVSADKGQVAGDATPLVIPKPLEAPNQFTELAKKLEPVVVNITTDYTPRPTARRQSPGEEEEDDGMELFRRFFRGPGPQPQPRRRGGTGSGFIVDSKGYIITNHHVVDEADAIKVKVHGDTREYKATLIGADTETDLAVIKISPGKTLPVAPIGNSDAVRVGDWAVAIGSPFGLEASVTAGIVSAMGRDNIAQQFQRFIQTDAAINPGNSGGPLLNIRGEVIGVNTMIATASGGYQGIGFALPMNDAVTVYNQIIRYGRVTRGSIGISWSRVQDRDQLLKALGTDHGVLVEAVKEGGPAARAGVKTEDIIIALNGKKVVDGNDLVARVAATPVGDKINVTVDRDGKKIDLPITVEDREEVFKDDPRFARSRPRSEPSREEGTEAKFGIYVRKLQAAERETAGVEGERGVLVTRVIEGSFAAEIGLQERDIIVSVNRQPVTDIDDLRGIQQTLSPGDAVAFRIMRPAAMSSRGSIQYQSLFLAGSLPTE